MCPIYFPILKYFQSLSVLRTLPDLGEEILHDLAKCLNETNDLAGFIATLRKSFKKHL